MKLYFLSLIFFSVPVSSSNNSIQQKPNLEIFEDLQRLQINFLEVKSLYDDYSEKNHAEIRSLQLKEIKSCYFEYLKNIDLDYRYDESNSHHQFTEWNNIYKHNSNWLRIKKKKQSKPNTTNKELFNFQEKCLEIAATTLNMQSATLDRIESDLLDDAIFKK